MFQLINLPYAPEALEPAISARTLSFHHGKHLQGYVDNLNKLIAGTEFESMSLEEIVVAAASPALRQAQGPALFNNAGQVLNHNLYFTQFKKAAPREMPPMSEDGLSMLLILPPSKPNKPSPDSALGKKIVEQWGSVLDFQKEFVAKGVGLFGSGWVWLQAHADGALSIGQYPGADNPVAHGLRPLLTFDVWEHAYYLDYQNRRAVHLEALWGIVDWNVVEERYNH